MFGRARLGFERHFLSNSFHSSIPISVEDINFNFKNVTRGRGLVEKRQKVPRII